MVPKHSAEVPSNVPEQRKPWYVLTEKISMLVELHSGLSYSDVGYEFNVNESAIYIK